MSNDIPTIILTLLKRDKATWTKRIEYRISNCAEKKIKTRPYSTLIQKSKDSSAFDEYKVKNIAIEYRLQSIFPNPGFIPMKVFLFWSILIVSRAMNEVMQQILQSN